MSISYNSDAEMIGGGGFGGAGNGLGFLPWLLLFANRDGGIFGGGSNQGEAVLAGATQSKLDCLEQGQGNLASLINTSLLDTKLSALATGITELGGISRDLQAAQTAQLNDLSRQLAECCCDTQTGLLKVENSIAMQTNVLGAQATANTQRIVDLITQNAQTALEQDNQRLRDQLNKAEIIAALGKGNASAV